MAVDKKVLEECILEAADGDAEMATYLRERYAKDEGKAAKFVGGYMRSSDYTKKTQELSGQRTQFEAQAVQLDTARKALEAAETEKNKIMHDLASHRITVAKAREMAKVLAEKYDLSETDLPGISDLIETAKTGKVVDNTPDLDTRLKTFGDDLMSRMEQKFTSALIPELGSMAALPMIWDEINREHTELTGKSLTFAEKQEILKVAKEGKSGGLVQVWEQKYGVTGTDGLRMKQHNENLKKTWEQEREAADAKKRQDEALNVVTPKQTDLGAGPGISGAFKTRFRTFEMDPNKAPVADNGGVPSLSVAPGQHVRQTGDRGPSGGQRAAQKFLERGGSAGYAKKTA